MDCIWVSVSMGKVDDRPFSLDLVGIKANCGTTRPNNYRQSRSPFGHLLLFFGTAAIAMAKSAIAINPFLIFSAISQGEPVF